MGNEVRPKASGLLLASFFHLLCWVRLPLPGLRPEFSNSIYGVRLPGRPKISSSIMLDAKIVGHHTYSSVEMEFAEVMAKLGQKVLNDTESHPDWFTIGENDLFGSEGLQVGVLDFVKLTGESNKIALNQHSH